MQGGRTSERGTVRVRLDTDSERTQHRLSDDDVVAFGRSAECPIRFGHLPVEDRSVPGRVGVFVTANHRIWVQADRSETHVLRPLRIRTAQGETQLAPGWGLSPADEHFTVIVTGERDWELDVTLLAAPLLAAGRGRSDEPTIDPRPQLEEKLWQALEAYAAPVLAGKRLPATHDQVAATIHYSRMETRRRLEAIHDEFYFRRLWMPDVTDTRIKVVEAAIFHNLLPRRTG